MEGFLNPKTVLSQLELNEEMTAADFGSGSGGWVIPLAKILKEGKVYAIDVLEEPLSALKSRADFEGVSNIEVILTDLEKEGKLKINDNSLDLVLMTNFLFQAKERENVFQEAKRILKKEGKILVIDWKPDSSLGPEKNRVSSQDVEKIAKNFDLKYKKKIEGVDYHYGLIFTKP